MVQTAFSKDSHNNIPYPSCSFTNILATALQEMLFLYPLESVPLPLYPLGFFQPDNVANMMSLLFCAELLTGLTASISCLKASQHQAERKPRKAWRKRFLV
jgi:hypothetical protein